MSQDLQNLEDLLAREGHDDVDALMGWARQRAAELVPDLEGDEELGSLLAPGGEAGDPPARSEAEVLRLEQVARREASNAAPLPPIPVSAPAAPPEELDDDEIEELDMEELELVDEDEADEVADDEPTGAGPAPMPPGPPAVEPAAETEETGETNSFGPPDGTEHVPEWKAALLSTQTETDQEAAEQVKEASSAAPLPGPEFPEGDAARPSGRLEAEHDEVSQHSVDLSDLDPDDE